jgi:transcriptional regulator with GAF, ATPase, and Fis domain
MGIMSRVDVSVSSGSAIAGRGGFEALVADIATEFVTVEPERLDATIEEALHRLAEVLGVDRSVLLQLTEHDLIRTHHWSRPGLPPLADPFELTSLEQRFPDVAPRLRRGEIVVIDDVADLPAEQETDRQSFMRLGTRSNMSVPLVASGTTIGVLAFAQLLEARPWPREIVDRLRLVAQMFASALARRRAHELLRQEIDDRLTFETLVTEIATRFASVEPDQIDGAIQDAQRRIVVALDLDRSTLFQISGDAIGLTHYWSRPEFPPIDDTSPPLAERFPYFTPKVLRGEVIVIDDVESLPPDLPDKAAIQGVGTKANVTLPLIAAGTTIGVLAFGCMRAPRRWPAEVVDRLRLIGQVFASTLARRRAHDELQHVIDDRLRFETLIADIASHFVNLEPDDIDGAIEDAQRQIVEALDVDRSALLQASDGDLVVTHYWSRPEFRRVEEWLPNEAAFPSLAPNIRRGELVVIDSLDDLPADLPDRRTLIEFGVQSTVAVPLMVSGQAVGLLSFDRMRDARPWPRGILDRLRFVAQVFASTLARRRAHDELRRVIEDRLRFETLIADIASQFVSLESSLVDGTIEDAMQRIAKALDVDRSTLLQNVGGVLVLTHHWSRPDVTPFPLERFKPVTLFPWSRAKVERGELVVFSSIDEIPADMPDREHYARIGTRSGVVVPLIASGRGIGCVTFSAVREQHTWAPQTISRLTLVGQVFASALARALSEAELRKTLEENARLRDRLVRENVYLQNVVKEGQGVEVMGQSAAIRSVLDEVKQVGPTPATVLLLGETGTGKELIASAIHERSPRRGRPMVRVNCAAIPTALIESELFGREKGAYTGALARQTGRFEVADGSTIFLDEIGELPLEVQVKLLRVLQEREIERLGSTRPIKIDVRIVAATNRDLEQMIADGTFREDLYYRLNVFPIRVPPLRERPEDIATLAWAFVDEFARALGKRIETIPKEQVLALQRYAWPGNVRELRNVIERAVITSPGPRLLIEPPRSKVVSITREAVRLDEVEREHIRAVLERTGWRIRGSGGAAELLGLKPSTLEGRMAKLDLRRPRAGAQ